MSARLKVLLAGLVVALDVSAAEPDLSWRQAAGEATPTWTIPYGKEFWRRSVTAAQPKPKDPNNSPATITDIDLGDIMDRVSHAISDNDPSGVARVQAKTYTAAFDGAGVRVSPHHPGTRVPETAANALRSPAHLWRKGRTLRTSHPLPDSDTEVTLRTRSVRLGSRSLYEQGARALNWSLRGNTAQALLNERIGLVEHYEAVGEGVWASWVLSKRPEWEGPLVIEIVVGGLNYVGTSDQGIHLADAAGTPRARVGKAVTVDSAGRRSEVPLAARAGGFDVRVSGETLAAATYPLAIDPLISPEFGMDQPVIVPRPGEHQIPSAAWNGTNWLVVWREWPVFGSPVDVSGGIDSSPAIGPDGSVYVGSWDYRVYSVNPHTGQINPGWPFVTRHYVRSSPAVAADGTIFIGSYDGRLYAVNPDGTAVGAPWPFYTGGAVFSSPVIGANGTVYVGSGNRKLYALSGLSGLARSPWPMFRHSPWHTGNPSTLTLSSGVRLQDLDFQFQIHGLSGMNCTVEGSHNLESWATLGSVTLPAGGVATFTDTQASGYAYRFYRVRSDSILSYNSLGYVAVEVPVGYSMIANQLDHPAGNAVGVLLPDSPEGTMLYKWDEGAQQFVINEFVSGVWEEPYMTLNPGEGALVQPGTATVFTFVGDLRQGTLANPYPSTFSIRSSLVPQSGPLDTGLGFQPAQGDRIDRWNNAIGDYELYTFFAGTWHPTVPIPRVGESFWISGTGNTWTRTFSIW